SAVQARGDAAGDVAGQRTGAEKDRRGRTFGGARTNRADTAERRVLLEAGLSDKNALRAPCAEFRGRGRGAGADREGVNFAAELFLLCVEPTFQRRRARLVEAFIATDHGRKFDVDNLFAAFDAAAALESGFIGRLSQRADGGDVRHIERLSDRAGEEPLIVVD